MSAEHQGVWFIQSDSSFLGQLCCALEKAFFYNWLTFFLSKLRISLRELAVCMACEAVSTW